MQEGGFIRVQLSQERYDLPEDYELCCDVERAVLGMGIDGDIVHTISEDVEVEVV